MNFEMEDILMTDTDLLIQNLRRENEALRAARELNRPSYGFEIDRVFYQRARDEMLRPSIDSGQIKLGAY